MIDKLVFGLASVLLFEGLVLAVAPNRIKKVVKYFETIPANILSLLGLLMVSLGVIFFYLVEI